MENFNFKDHTTIGLGGPAESLTICTSVDEAIDLSGVIKESQIPFLLFGGGSNLLVSDEGFAGKAVQLKIMKREMNIDDNCCNVVIGAGEDFDSVIKELVEEDWSGLEFLSGIPGWAGAAPIQNIGAFGSEVSDTITKVTCLDTQNGEVVELSNEECQFGYRSSIFNGSEKGRYWVLYVEFKLTRPDKVEITYPELAERVESKATGNIGLIREKVLELRKERGMLSGDGMPKSAGSFFKNPIVENDLLQKIQSEYASGVPCYPHGDRYKIPAAWLIGQTSFKKGYTRNGVGVSKYHNLCLVNHGNGTFKELMSLASNIQEEVREQFGIQLDIEPEVSF